MSVYADVTRLRAEAATVDPVKFFLAVVAAPFVLLGLVLRFAWMVPAFLYVSAQYGWRKADEVVKARQAEARAG